MEKKAGKKPPRGVHGALSARGLGVDESKAPPRQRLRIGVLVQPADESLIGGTNGVAGKKPCDQPEADPRQVLFAEAIAAGMNPHQAAKRAGYTSSGSVKQLEHPTTAALINLKRIELARVQGISKEKVLDMFMEAFQLSRTLEDPATMVRAATEVGKMLGYYAPEVKQFNIDVRQLHTVRQLEELSTEQLAKMVDEAGDIEDMNAEQFEYFPAPVHVS